MPRYFAALEQSVGYGRGSLMGTAVNMDAVVNKTMFLNASTQKHKVPICTSELRFLFRNRERLKQNGKVLF